MEYNQRSLEEYYEKSLAGYYEQPPEVDKRPRLISSVCLSISFLLSFAFLIVLSTGSSDQMGSYLLVIYGSFPITLIGLNYADITGSSIRKFFGVLALSIHCLMAFPIVLATLIHFNFAIIIPWFIIGFFVIRKRLRKRNTMTNGIISAMFSHYIATLLALSFFSLLDWLSISTSFG